MIEWIKDRYLTWRTGMDKETRDYFEWYNGTVVVRAGTIENMFMHFRYIVPVSIDMFDHSEPFGWVPCEDFLQYTYPRRDLSNCAVYCFARGYRDQWDGKFHFSDMQHDHDQVFVATNNSKDAMMIALKYSS